ncbi:oxidoreductase, putative, partial [Ricinus communis]
MSAAVTLERPVTFEKKVAPEDRFIRNSWYVALWADELPAGKLVHQTILGEPVVLYRKEDGAPAAIVDRCSHRFAPLSMGKLLPGNRIQCPYHGLEFDQTGKCVKNPHGNCTIPAASHLRSFPVIEKYKFIWIWMGDTQADPAKIPDYSCLDTAPAAHITDTGYLNIKAHYELIVDNLLDLSHTAYVHEGILGNSGTVVADIGVEQVGDVITVARPSKDTVTPGMLQMLSPGGFERGDQHQTISWYAPSNLILEFGVSKVGEPKSQGTGYLALHLITPETARSSHYRFRAVRWG